VFEGLREGDALGHAVLERIEVHHHHVHRRDTLVAEGRSGRGAPATGQDAGVDLRVQGLHAAVEDLGEPGDLGDAGDLHSLLGQLLGGAAGGDDLEAAVGQAAREVGDAFLAVDGQDV